MSDVAILLLGKHALGPTGLSLRGLNFEEWAHIGKELYGMTRVLNWCVGDWLNYGVKEFGDRRALAIDHAEMFGINAETVRRIMYVADRIVRRRTSLSWSHHSEVASLSPREQQRWLDKAEESDWSQSQLRQAIRHASGDLAEKPARLSVPFNPQRWSLDWVRWIEHQDIDEWDSQSRASIKKYLQPIVQVWERL